MSKPASDKSVVEEVLITDSTLRQNIGYNMKRAFNVIKSDLVKTLKPHGLRMLTYTALVLIVDNPGLRQRQLAQAMDIEHPNLVKILDELEGLHLIVREPVQHDRRVHALHASKAGLAVYAKAIKAVELHEDVLFKGLGKRERTSLIKVLQHVSNQSHNQDKA